MPLTSERPLLDRFPFLLAEGSGILRLVALRFECLQVDHLSAQGFN